MKKSAFPSKKLKKDERTGLNIIVRDSGISQRLYIATKLMSALIASGNRSSKISDEAYIKECFNIADELIKQDDES